MMAPDISPSTETMVNGIRYQVGNTLAMAPMGSLPTFLDKAPLEMARSRP